MNHSHEVTVITGGASGIGHACASLLAEAGHHVLIVDNAPPQPNDELTARPEIVHLRGDVCQSSTWRRADEATAGLTLVGLATCAGVMTDDDHGIVDTPRAAWKRTLDVNVMGSVLACQWALTRLVEGRGAIVTVGSVVALRGSAIPQVAYTASKGAIRSFSRELAVAEAHRGIRVNHVLPGIVATPMTAHLTASDSDWARRVAHIPAAKSAKPREVAEAIVWLLSERASYVNGAELVVDGGLSASFITGRET
jgi:NAD(P)-dependent dehydrogenase (short-subunit alcohol dehydrogenase family)